MTANPTLLSMPLAQNGQKNVIPETQATAGDGLFSQSTGFPSETSLPLGAGGVAPSREDFNGLANLLGGVAFMAQKGFTFNYDATQDYYAGCVVMDNGNKYLCIADMTAGTVAPSADTTHDYWIFYPVGVINKRDVITTSGTYTAPVTGWYKITVKGGGGSGGSGFFSSASSYFGGCGGGEGGTTVGYERMTAGQTASVVIGAGGASVKYVSSLINGNAGGNSSVTINNNTYTANGGAGGIAIASGGAGGTGTIYGASGENGQFISTYSTTAPGGTGGGNGGGPSITAGINGGGGGGGAIAYNNTSYASGAGGNGYATVEYFDPTLM